MLNHASFGLVTDEVADLAESVRRELEADSLVGLDLPALLPRVRSAADTAARHLGLQPGSVTLTPNATSGGASLMRSYPLRAGEQVAVLATEYASILRGWQVRCDEVGARCTIVDVPVPLGSASQLLDAVSAQVHGPVAIAQLSLVSSSTAISFPVAELAAWFKDRGAIVALDVAHGPGHVALSPEPWGVDAMHGTLHKWYPTPRPVGFLWVAEGWRGRVRPAEVSLTWDSDDLVERFCWPGTYDPTPRLCVEAAIAQWDRWQHDGDLDRCAGLADAASDVLAALGTPTCEPALRPPRLRAAVLHDRDPGDVRTALQQAGIRAFVGVGPHGETMLRVATHVFTEHDDLVALCDAVRGAS